MNLTKVYSRTLVMVPMDILLVSTLHRQGHTLPKVIHHKGTLHRGTHHKGTHHKGTHQQDILLVLTHSLGILGHLLHISQVKTQVSSIILLL